MPGYLFPLSADLTPSRFAPVFLFPTEPKKTLIQLKWESFHLIWAGMKLTCRTHPLQLQFLDLQMESFGLCKRNLIIDDVLKIKKQFRFAAITGDLFGEKFWGTNFAMLNLAPAAGIILFFL